jgi:hypothetical protein
MAMLYVYGMYMERYRGSIALPLVSQLYARQYESHMHDEFVSCGRLRSELEPLEGPPRSGIEKRNHSSSAGSQRADLDGSDLRRQTAVLGCSFD